MRRVRSQKAGFGRRQKAESRSALCRLQPAAFCLVPIPAAHHPAARCRRLEFGRCETSAEGGEPSPSGRGQGEGSDVAFASAVIGAEARDADSRMASSARSTYLERASEVGVGLLRSVGSSSAPTPVTAKEEATSDPSPCPLPEGEGSLRCRRSLRTTNPQPAARCHRARRQDAGAPMPNSAFCPLPSAWAGGRAW